MDVDLIQICLPNLHHLFHCSSGLHKIGNNGNISSCAISLLYSSGIVLVNRIFDITGCKSIYI